MFDVNAPETMDVLKKWWAEFVENAPVAEGDMDNFCCVVVGNKVDIPRKENTVTGDEALAFLNDLIPTSNSQSPVADLPHSEAGPKASPPKLTARPPSQIELSRSGKFIPAPSSPQTRSIDIIAKATPGPSTSTNNKQLSKKSSAKFYNSTLASTQTTYSIYHTPSSSLFDVFQSARSSPEHWSSISSSSTSPPSPPFVQPSSPDPLLADNLKQSRSRRLTVLSARSSSTGSLATITPSLFAREREAANSGSNNTSLAASSSPSEDPFLSSLPPAPFKGPKLFLTSAKTGEGVSDVFSYIAKRVVRRMEYLEKMEERKLHLRESSAAETIRLGLLKGGFQRGGKNGGPGGGSCCSS